MDSRGIRGRAVTPFLLERMRALTGGESVRANVKLAISGGQNEPRKAIAGTVWALLTHPEQLDLVRKGEVTWLEAFEEYARWISPIGMSPRRIAKPWSIRDVSFETATTDCARQHSLFRVDKQARTGLAVR